MATEVKLKIKVCLKMTRRHERRTRIQDLNAIEVAIQYDQWRWRMDDIEAEKSQFLRDSGWEKTCDNPSSLWLWKKGQYYVSKNVALELEHDMRESVPAACSQCSEYILDGLDFYRTEDKHWVCEKCVGEWPGSKKLSIEYKSFLKDYSE